jgi:glutathione S-transferase
MALTFYWAAGSPPSWRVMLALEHKELPYESRLLSFANRDHKSAEFLAVNPRGLVPALVDDGFAIWESTAIVEYLDERYPESGAPLFPRDAREAAIVRRLVQEIDYYVAPQSMRLGRQIFMRKPEELDRDEIADARRLLLAELAALDTTLTKSGGGFLAGALSAADFALYPHLGSQRRMAKKAPDAAVISDLGPGVREWMERIEALPFFDKTFPPHWK